MAYPAVKGVHVRFRPSMVFPNYPNTSGSHVSQRRVNRLKPIALAVLQDREKTVFKAFQAFARRRHSDRPPKVRFDLETALRRVEGAAVCPEGVYGECDEARVWVAREKMNDAYLLGTLLHEALHYAVTFNGKFVCEDDEHAVFRALGDDC